MTKIKLTERQKQVYECIKDQIISFGAPPTIREIGKKLRITSTNGVRQHINALIKKGYIKKHEHTARGIEILENINHMISRVPLVGSVPAGNPIDAIENQEGEIAIGDDLFPSLDTFSLRVVGDSMINAGIFNGDIVIVQKQKTARTGDIIVAIIGDEATVKKYYPEKGIIRLQPENDRYEPIIVDKHSPAFSIAGKVVGLIRKL